MRRHRLGIAAHRLCEKRGGAHFLEQVQAVVARRAVGADADVDAARQHGRHGREAARELEVRRGAMRDGGALVREHSDLLARDMHRVRRDQPRSQHAQRAQALERPRLVPGKALLDLMAGLVQVGVDGKVELLGDGDDLRKSPVAHRIRRVRGHAEGQERLSLESVARRESLGDVIVGVRRVGRGELERDDAERRADSGLERRARRRLREKIHLVEAGHAAAQHLGASEQRAVVYEFGRHVPRFGGPDVIPQPGHQGKVVGEPAHQRHRRVGVQIHEARDQGVPVQARMLAGLEALLGLARGQHRDDAPFCDRNAVIVEDCPRGLDRDHPAGADEEVDRLHLKKSPALGRGTRIHRM